ncbi:MAG: DUF1272 domain-containing protein [Cellvibrionaceae bacterium]
MLQLRPNCERCDVDLPPQAKNARICTYECTFCSQCVDEVLKNVCPNCGGGFTPRPIRPSQTHRAGVSLKHQPASTERIHTAYNEREIAEFCEPLKEVPSDQR